MFEVTDYAALTTGPILLNIRYVDSETRFQRRCLKLLTDGGQTGDGHQSHELSTLNIEKITDNTETHDTTWMYIREQKNDSE